MKKKSNRFAIILASGILIFVTAAAGFVGYLFLRDWMTLKELKTEHAALSGDLDSWNNKNDALQKDIDESGTDSFIERMARELLGWVKPGEIKIVDKDK